MKTLRLFVVLAALLFAGVLAPSPVRARETVSFDFFYDSLAPYGEWVQVGDYGLCWRPTDVDPDWTPYSDGYWAYTDAGWTWVSYEEFGGIVYHYGRWIRLDDDSWCWTPDYEWGPAWVSWRTSDDYVGWAPLPPEARWRPEVGISVWVDREYDLGPGYYSFCHTRDFGAPVMRGVCINRRENVTIIRSTVNVTNITYNRTYVDGPVIFNGGPSFAVINRVSTRPIPALKLVQEANFDPARHRGPNGRASFNAQTVGNQLIVAAPQVQKPTDPAAFKARAKRILPGDSVTRGWNGVKNPEIQKELRQEMGRQSKGLTPTTAPARAVVATDLKAVPTKADPTATPPTTANTERRDRPERPDRPGKGPRPESVVVQPNTNPPANPPIVPTATPFVKPTAPVTTTTPGNPAVTPSSVTRERGRDRNDRNANPPGAPTAGNPNLKPFNPTTDTRPLQNPTTAITPVPRSTSTDDNNGAKNRAAEQGRMRAEQQQQQRAEQQRIDQQRQADSAAKQKQADMAAERQKQMAEQQEAARSRAEEQRRRDTADQQRQQQMQAQQQQQLQLRQQQQLQQQQQQRSIDARRAQEAERAAREHARDQSESQRPPQPRQLPPQPRQLPPQPQPQPQQNTQGGGSPRTGGGQQHSKGGDKDKDKDKDKDRN